MGVMNCGRTLFLVIAIILTIFAIAFGIVAFLTPSWQVVFIDEFQTEHQHGLWMDCTRYRKRVLGLSLENLRCTYKFNEPDNDDSNSRTKIDEHVFAGWHIAVLILCIASVISGMNALVCSFYSHCSRMVAIFFNIFLLISILLSIGALVTFFVNQSELRFMHQGVEKVYEQSWGYSFWFEMASMITFVIAFVVSIVSTVLIIRYDHTIQVQQHRV